MAEKTLSLVVPVYDSPDLTRILAGHVPQLAKIAAVHGFHLAEAVFVDDGGAQRLTEADLAAAAPVPVRLLRNEVNLGKGGAVRRGALSAAGAWVLMSDVDESTPLTEFAQLAPEVSAWMVCGSRYREWRRGVPFHRRLLSVLFNLCVRSIGVRGIRDTQCGFKLFRMDVMRSLFEVQKINRFAFDVELIKRVQLSGGTVSEIPVVWQGGHRSSLRVFRDAPRMLSDLYRLLRLRRPAQASGEGDAVNKIRSEYSHEKTGM